MDPELHEKYLYEALQCFIEKYLSNFKPIIKHIYRLKYEIDYVFHYSIIFTDKSKQFILYKFLDEFENSNYKIPLYFQEIPNELETVFLDEMNNNNNFEKVEL